MVAARQGEMLSLRYCSAIHIAGSEDGPGPVGAILWGLRLLRRGHSHGGLPCLRRKSIHRAPGRVGVGFATQASMSRSSRLGGILAFLLIASLSGAGVAGAQPQAIPIFSSNARAGRSVSAGAGCSSGQAAICSPSSRSSSPSSRMISMPDACVRRWRRRCAANRGGLRCRVRRQDRSLRVPGSRRQRSAADYAGDPPPPGEPERQFEAGTDAARPGSR